jgi:hypothetical protein
MKGFAYLDTVNNRIRHVNVRYPEDFNHCVGRPTLDDLVTYLHKHPDEHDYLIKKHDMKNRLFRQQAYEAKQYDLANSKSFMPKLRKDESFAAHLEELNDTP